MRLWQFARLGLQVTAMYCILTPDPKAYLCQFALRLRLGIVRVAERSEADIASEVEDRVSRAVSDF